MHLREAGLPLGIRKPRRGRTLKFRVESLELRELHTLNIQHSTLNSYRPPRGRFLCQPPAHRQGGGCYSATAPMGLASSAVAHYTP